jgi:hypothetical protein
MLVIFWKAEKLLAYQEFCYMRLIRPLLGTLECLMLWEGADLELRKYLLSVGLRGLRGAVE